MLSADAAPIPTSQSQFGERYKIDTAARLPEFDTPGGEAYGVTDKEATGDSLYALVHRPGIPIRNRVYLALKKKPVANLICPKDRGLANVALKGGSVQRLVTIFERPKGGALMSPQGVKNERVTAAKLRQKITLSALKAIAALHKVGYAHRSIRPTAIYFASPDSDEIMIGECCSCAPSYWHPAPLEALEGSFMDPVARPKAGMPGDFYQFGAALLCLYHGAPLWDSRDAKSFATARVNQGSFWALGGGQDVPGTMGNLIKGLMADDIHERWNAGDVLNWFEGAVEPKRSTIHGWALNRPTRYKGSSYIDRRLLADAWSAEPIEAAKYIRELDFPTWAQMSFRDEVLDEKDEKLLGVGKAEGLAGSRTEEVRMVARVSMFLHPQGPVRYRRLAVSLDHFGGAVADAFCRDDRDKVRVLAELLDIPFLNSLVEVVSGRSPEFAAHAAALRPYCDHAKSQQLGRGMERVLYEMNPALCCLSSKFKNSWVASPEQVMRSLERMASKGSISSIILDRHVAAFMSKHNPGLEREFQKLYAAKGDKARFNNMVAEFLGSLQTRLKLEDLPALTGRVIDGLKPAVQSLKNKKSRDKVNGLLDKIRKGGDLSKLSTDVNLTKIMASDARDFSKAQGLLARLDRERARLSQRILPSDPEAMEKGIKGMRTLAFIGFAGIIAALVI